MEAYPTVEPSRRNGTVQCGVLHVQFSSPMPEYMTIFEKRIFADCNKMKMMS